MANPSDEANRQHIGEEAVDDRVRLAEDTCQLNRVDEGHLAEAME